MLGRKIEREDHKKIVVIIVQFALSKMKDLPWGLRWSLFSTNLERSREPAGAKSLAGRGADQARSDVISPKKGGVSVLR